MDADEWRSLWVCDPFPVSGIADSSSALSTDIFLALQWGEEGSDYRYDATLIRFSPVLPPPARALSSHFQWLGHNLFRQPVDLH
ncbi:MAG: hypothetical protein CV081_10025 [Nitrospira sp. LK265]|nr:hypothetical protein [Nitrospira sp. LK265]